MVKRQAPCPQKNLYYGAMTLNFRLSSLHPQALITIVASLEIIRHGIWNFFRLDNEHLNNVGKYRAFKSVPLPFNYDENEDKDDGLGRRVRVGLLDLGQSEKQVEYDHVGRAIKGQAAEAATDLLKANIARKEATQEKDMVLQRLCLKLETTTIKDKDVVFQEIMPQAFPSIAVFIALSYLVLIYTHAMLVHLASLPVELETLMPVLLWVLENSL
ncbi:hypothetical protein IFM89_030790, partial [Coptis chinensis]